MRQHTCYGEDEFAELLNNKSLQMEFSQQRPCHFWIRTRNECPIISDLDIHKPLAFYTTYLRKAAFSKLIIIKSKNQSFIKYVENVLRPGIVVSIYEWVICVQIVKCIHPISCA